MFIPPSRSAMVDTTSPSAGVSQQVDTTEIVKSGGALNCISWTIKT